jgi:glycolate oxidase FAD binding subunit
MSTATGTLSPVTSTAEVRERVCDAAARGTPLRIVGRGGWLDAGRPVRAADRLSLDALTGVVEYTPGDLTLTARAGTPLEEIARVTAAEGQWLALDPFGAPAGTIGATVATASAGPLAHAFGTPRDCALGLETVTGAGAVVRTGGRVVKNVAGFDLTRLFTGSWGTLAVITEVTVRLRALPEVDESYALPVDESTAALDTLLARLREASLAPLAVELASPALAERLGAGDRAVILVRLGGNAPSVRAQRGVLGALGEVAPVPRSVWGALRGCEPARAAVARFSQLASRLADTWSFVRDATSDVAGALVHASAGRGIVRCILPFEGGEELGRFLSLAPSFPGARIFERLPAAAWQGGAAPSAVSDRLSRGVKRRYDPTNILNPGILGEDA